MLILKLLLLSLLALIALLLLAALVMRRKYSIICKIEMNTQAAAAYDFVRHLKNQDRFNKWVMVEPNMQRIFKGQDGELGFVYGWNGNKKAGEGEQEIKSLIENKQVVTEIRFKRPIEGLAISIMDIEDLGNGNAQISWTNDSEMKYPLNVLLPFIEKLLAKDMNESLVNLKKIMENKP